MQISNSSIIASSFSGVSNTSRRSTLADQYPAKPVTIEGQIIDDNDEKKHARKLERENLSADQPKKESSEDQTSNENQQQLIASSTDSKSEELGASLLLQTKLNSGSEPGQLSPEKIENKLEHSFPYTNRRSSNGLAGAPLIIQKYLNNEADTSSRPDNISFSRFI